jgi:hypothetical protein
LRQRPNKKPKAKAKSSTDDAEFVCSGGESSQEGQASEASTGDSISDSHSSTSSSAVDILADDAVPVDALPVAIQIGSVVIRLDR